MPSASFLRRLRRWHRGTGLFLLLWVLLVAVTGVALNHSAGLGLDKLRLTSPLLLRLYAIELKEPQGIPVDRHWLSVGGDRQLYLDALAIGHCERLDGAAVTEAGIYAACGDALMVIDRQGRIVERLPPPPTPTNDASRFGLCAGAPCIETGDTQLALDPVHLTWQPTAAALSAPAPNSGSSTPRMPSVSSTPRNCAPPAPWSTCRRRWRGCLGWWSNHRGSPNRK